MPRLLLIALLLVLPLAHAEDLAAIKERLQKNHPQVGPIDQVNKTPIPGLYEVATPEHLFYVDESGDYLIDGHIFDLRKMHNITEDRIRQLYAVNFDGLPFDLALKQIKGNGKRKLVVFTDPNCGFCKKLEGELQQVDNVTIYRLLYPIFPGSEEKVRNVWCSKNKVKAWEDLMVRGIAPAAATCATPTAKVVEWGQKLRVDGTPSLFFADGTHVPGYLPAAELNRALDAAERR